MSACRIPEEVEARWWHEVRPSSHLHIFTSTSHDAGLRNWIRQTFASLSLAFLFLSYYNVALHQEFIFLRLVISVQSLKYIQEKNVSINSTGRQSLPGAHPLAAPSRSSPTAHIPHLYFRAMVGYKASKTCSMRDPCHPVNDSQTVAASVLI